MYLSVQGQTTGFTLDSLLKLNTAKAFDKKTSILHYLVILAKRNDPTLLDFKDVRVTPDTSASASTNRGNADCACRGRHGAPGVLPRGFMRHSTERPLNKLHPERVIAQSDSQRALPHRERGTFQSNS